MVKLVSKSCTLLTFANEADFKEMEDSNHSR